MKGCLKYQKNFLFVFNHSKVPLKQNFEEAKVVLDCLLSMAANLFRNEQFRISQDLNCSLFLLAYLSKIVVNVEAFLTRCN